MGFPKTRRHGRISPLLLRGFVNNRDRLLAYNTSRERKWILFPEIIRDLLANDPRTFWTNGSIAGTLFAAPAYATYSKLIVQGEFKPGFKLTLGLKDIRLALAAGEAIGVPLPFASVVRDNLVDAIGHGDAGKDWSALALVARRRAGLGGDAPRQ
jgi:hypothetical protein